MFRCLAISVSVLWAGIAQAATYDCTMKAGSGDRDFIPKTIRVTYDGGKATVFDEFIQAKYGKPIAATFRQRDASSLQFNWEAEVTYKRNRTSQADFQMILRPGQGKSTLTVHVPGNIEPSQAKGKCRPGN